MNKRVKLFKKLCDFAVIFGSIGSFCFKFER